MIYMTTLGQKLLVCGTHFIQIWHQHNKSKHIFISIMEHLIKSSLIIIIFMIVAQNLVIAQESGSGICSYYGEEGEIPEGWPTACGDEFHRLDMATAHPSLPCGTWIRVINSADGRSVDVRVNDRGPFVPGRILDLTYGAFDLIAEHTTGIISCSYHTI